MVHYMRLKLRGVLQSYGGPESSWVARRDTGPMPTREAMAGLLACALGVRKGEPAYDRLLSLDYLSTRCSTAQRREDYQIIAPREPGKSTKDSVFRTAKSGSAEQLPIIKVYLENAAFDVLVGSESLDELSALHYALRHPVWAYYLGRACCTPSSEIVPPVFETKSLPEWQAELEAVVCI